MQQILKFKIEIFDTRTRTSINIIDDTALVSSIQINKGTTLDNIATIVFLKSKTYEMLPMETILKLYNYVKIELEVRNYNPTNLVDNKGEMFYFSGFIQTINKSSQFGQTPSAAVTITISDYANLMKTTFYTKNLTFLEILNQAVPEFRMINFSEYLGDTKNELLDSFYSPTQMGFIFFAFIFFKFMYRIVYDENGETKKKASPDSKEIFKKFKIYMPFGFPLSFSTLSEDTGDESVNVDESILKGQETGLMIYKQLQGVALDLFKYLYPEPLFEFTTYETKDSVILMIRFTPLMKFDRPVLAPQNITFGAAESDVNEEAVFHERSVSTLGSTFTSDSYNVIEFQDFGFKRIKSIREKTGVSPAQQLKYHLADKNILNMLSKNLDEKKNVKVEDLIANDSESDKITDLFFNPIKIDTKYLETLSMTRSASSVVNVIWTVPTTDTAVLKMSGREMVYAYMQQRLNEVGGNDQFGNYVYQQFNPGFYANPVFLMDYRGVFGQDFVSGDMNYFGFREFEIKWNYLSVEYSTIGHILKYVDVKTLAKAKKGCGNKKIVAALDNAIRAVGDKTQQTSSAKYNTQARDAFERYSSSQGAKTVRDKNGKITGYDFSQPINTYIPAFNETKSNFNEVVAAQPTWNPIKTYRQSIRSTTDAKPSKNKKVNITEAANDDNFKKAMIRYGLSTEDLKNADKIFNLVKRAKDEDTNLMGGFVSKINSIVASAYRENEHLYDCQMLKPIDVKILPGMVVESDNESIKAKSPRFKGYVTSISHSIDFNAATMKTNINVSRAASDDSAVYPLLMGYYPD